MELSKAQKKANADFAQTVGELAAKLIALQSAIPESFPATGYTRIRLRNAADELDKVAVQHRRSQGK